jgi:hypothetical protein
MNIKQRVKSWLYKNYPSSRKVIISFFEKHNFLRKILMVGRAPTFVGWGMTTCTAIPWGDEQKLGAIEHDYSQACKTLVDLITNHKFSLSQFKDLNKLEMLESLRWRHYIVYWSSHYAIVNTRVATKNLVECGVCDGLTSFFAMSAASNQTKNWAVYLYDAWAEMKENLLLASEKKNKMSYDYLDVELTKKNLEPFQSHITFNKGFIPESFAVSQNPDSIVWLHIDLNSATPTLAALDFFWDKLASGGVILFDDYNWIGYEDTKKVILDWLSTRAGTLLPLPTGQAIIFKSNL